MITLTSNSQRFDVFGPAFATNPHEYYLAYVASTSTTYTPAVTSGTGNGSYTVLSGPASGAYQLKYFSLYNADTVAQTITIVFFSGAANRTLFKATIQPGETIAYEVDVGWVVLTSSGSRKSDTNTQYANVAPPSAQRVLMSPLNRSGAAKLLITNTGYFVYVGQTYTAVIPKFVEFHVTTAGAATQTAEVGLFSTPVAPNKAAQSLTKLVATGTVDNLTTTGVKRNTSAFATVVDAGTHLWAGIRTAHSPGAQPTIEGLNFDMGQGQIMTATTPGALTGAGPFTGVLVAASLHGAVSDVPDLRVTLD